MSSENRDLVVLGQNETGRSSGSQANVYLSTVGLFGCVAVIFYSEETKRISLTHADTKTDFHFLLNEWTWVGKEDCKVFLIKNKGDLAVLIRRALIKADVSQVTEQYSEQGTVVFNHTKRVPQFFSQSDFVELTLPKKVPNPGNKLHTLKYQPRYMQDPVIAQKNTYIRQLNAAISDVCSHYPILAFNESGWSKFQLELASDVMSKIEKNEIKESALPSFTYVWGRYQTLISQLSIAAARGIEITPVVDSANALRRN